MTNLVNKIARIVPARQEHLEELTRLANAANHNVLAPTSVIKKKELIAGYLSIGALPTVFTWLSKDLSPRDSTQIFAFMEDVIAHGTAPTVIFPVNKQSPFNAIAEKAGYINTGEYNLYIKPLTQQ